MNSILTVTEAADSYDLTTLAHVKLELGITDTSKDALLAAQITQASAAIASWCRRVFAAEAVSEDIWPDEYGGCLPYRVPLALRRYPVAAEGLTATLDGDVVVAGNLRLDPGAGLLYRLDDGGYPSTWRVCKLLTVAYTGGYELPATLPADIERACILWVKDTYFAADRDPRLRSEQAYDVASFSYFDRSDAGDAIDPPAEVARLLAPFRCAIVA